MSVLDNITRKVTDTAKAAAKKSGNVVESTRLSMSIGAEEDKIRKIYADMGRVLYDEYTEGKNLEGSLLEQCERIDAINHSIEEMKQKILELKNVKACPGCGTELDLEMVYCHKCGRKQETVQAEDIGENSAT